MMGFMVTTALRQPICRADHYPSRHASARELEAVRYELGVSRYFMAKLLGQPHMQHMSDWTRGRRAMSAKYSLRLTHLYRQWRNDAIDLAYFDPDTYWEEVGL